VLTELAGLGRDGTGALTDDILRSIAVTGDPAGCARAIAALREAGADSVVLLPHGDDALEQLSLVLRGLSP
jgi:alkanesulfonate monooxygenase SsuD/methylene tetrahydromethanopterin reductase-like flavin-dependent oxidoreductase (luciferase family)